MTSKIVPDASGPAAPAAVPRYLVVGGAEKAGTTSLFGYLAAHPQVCASAKKETDHFRAPAATLAGYETFFAGDGAVRPVRAESSPGYLAEAEAVAPRLAATLPQARLVFVLRDPVDRLRSCYRFYQSRLHVPATMSFDHFALACLDHEQDAGVTAGLQPWHLRATGRGRYERLLPAFERAFPADQILLVDYERLRRDAAGVTLEIAAFAGLEPGFYSDFAFARENVSFRARNGGLQRLAIGFNDGLEALWRRRPGLKRWLLRWYKRMNEQPLRDDPLSAATQARLDAYYAPTRADLARRFGTSA